MHSSTNVQTKVPGLIKSECIAYLYIYKHISCILCL